MLLRSLFIYMWYRYITLVYNNLKEKGKRHTCESEKHVYVVKYSMLIFYKSI